MQAKPWKMYYLLRFFIKITIFLTKKTRQLLGEGTRNQEAHKRTSPIGPVILLQNMSGLSHQVLKVLARIENLRFVRSKKIWLWLDKFG